MEAVLFEKEADNSCTGCVFVDVDCRELLNLGIIPQCRGVDRPDGKDVIFVNKDKEVKKLTLPEKIVQDIIADIKDRRGLKHEWDSIDEDIQREIVIKWVGIINKYIKGDSDVQQ